MTWITRALGGVAMGRTVLGGRSGSAVRQRARHPITGGATAMTEHHSAGRARLMVVRALRGLAVILVLTGMLWRAAPVDAASEPTSYYLSLGDSLAQGFQPIGGPHTGSAAAGYNQGYANQLFKQVRDGGGEHLRLVKLGCGGETTASMIGDGADSFCSDDYDTGSQLGDAVEFLNEHPGQIAFITINIGINDVFECQGNPGCIRPQIATNLPTILDTLRDHAGPDVPIVGMNYYSPFVVDWFDDPAAGQLAAAQIVGFNNFLESLYAGADVPVADVESAFAVTDFTTLADLKHVGPVPFSVYNACTLTWICTGPPHGPDIHANSDGYGVIAEAFAAVLGV
jgi:lysophospholipase L1-like esterase